MELMYFKLKKLLIGDFGKLYMLIYWKLVQAKLLFIY